MTYVLTLFAYYLVGFIVLGVGQAVYSHQHRPTPKEWWYEPLVVSLWPVVIAVNALLGAQILARKFTVWLLGFKR